VYGDTNSPTFDDFTKNKIKEVRVNQPVGLCFLTVWNTLMFVYVNKTTPVPSERSVWWSTGEGGEDFLVTSIVSLRSDE
jgi:hypothetical protein